MINGYVHFQLVQIIILARVGACSGKLHRRTPLGDSFLEIVGSGGIRSSTSGFLLTILFQRERCEVPLVVTIMGHTLSLYGEVSWRRMS
jgi:hypothetical protein